MLFVLMVVRNVIVSNLLRPIIYGKTVNLHPAVVLIVLPAGFAIAGIFGLFVAIPMAAFFVAISGAVVSILADRGAGASPSRAIRMTTRRSRSGSTVWANGACAC